MSGLIYLDNAATTFPKPKCVSDAVRDAILYTGGNPGRGSHKLSGKAAELVYDTRETAAGMFGAKAENVVFTMNATQALNFAIKGQATDGCHILLDNFSHNAVYRPVIALHRERKCTYDIYDALGTTEETLNNIRRKLCPETQIIIATHQSNICSKILPIREIGELCKRCGKIFIVDASQSAGHVSIDLERDNITSLCLPGHKGLFGPMGVGMLISGANAKYNPIIEGGAGISSLDSGMPDVLPERLEAGTLPLAAIAGLNAGMKWVLEIGQDRIHAYEKMLSDIVSRESRRVNGIKIYGKAGGPVVSFNILGHSPAKIGEYLSSRGICVRTGYHCAPLAHKTVGSFESGSVRIGLSYMNRPSDIYTLFESLRELN
ncbi:MAG: aminotransferase class V-fold PLP-dependent enzyme [Ruminococcaceae bacterium]|nr:aminotransferase class V-fold PLP-dependent enzyme [Oscillospiraceae bacterium]